MGMMTKRTGQVRKANTAKLKYVFMVDPTAMVNLKATSRSVTLKSDDTYKYKHISVWRSFSVHGKKSYSYENLTRLSILPRGVES